jgi:hypothetical protein
VLTLPFESLAVHVTGVAPRASSEPDAGLHRTGTGPSSLSTAVNSYVTLEPPGPVASAVTSCGRSVKSGALWSHLPRPRPSHSSSSSSSSSSGTPSWPPPPPGPDESQPSELSQSSPPGASATEGTTGSSCRAKASAAPRPRRSASKTTSRRLGTGVSGRWCLAYCAGRAETIRPRRQQPPGLWVSRQLPGRRRVEGLADHALRPSEALVEESSRRRSSRRPPAGTRARAPRRGRRRRTSGRRMARLTRTPMSALVSQIPTTSSAEARGQAPSEPAKEEDTNEPARHEVALPG